MQMPTRTPTPLSPSSPVILQVGVSRHLAFVHCLARPSTPGDDLWLTACYQLTPRLQRFGPDAALLDLGPCTEDEAVAVMQTLITQLRDQQVTVRVGIAQSGILAQLALLHMPTQESLAHITPEHVDELLHALPVAALAQVRLAAPTPITAEVVAQLDGYGIRSLAQLARLDEEQLRRQFGARIGKILTTMARGDDVLPFQPTPAPLWLHYRLRLTAPISPDRLLLGLSAFTGEVAAALAHRGAQARTLELRLRWENSSVERITRTLPQPIADSRALTETMARLLAPLLEARSALTPSPMVEDLRLILSDLSPRYPEQHAFWPQRAQRLAAAHEVAEVLARRHGKPLLFHRLLASPDAIFDQNRSRQVPLAADVAESPASGAAWPPAHVTSTGIPHGTHWW